jgi:hypothetical protein
MGAVNQQKIQAVRAKREEQPYGGRSVAAVAPGGGPVETRAERLARMAAEIQKGDKA